MVTKFNAFFRRQAKKSIGLLAILAILAIGFADMITGSEISFSIFYLAPIIFATWYADQGSGYALAALGCATWLTADLLAGHVYAHPAIPFWNALVRLGFFVVTVALMTKIQHLLARETRLASNDPLTGVHNSRAFYELAGREAERSKRYHRFLTLAYLDLDNFKAVNDQYGHDQGDALLRRVAEDLKANTRATDIVARLGGDEFAILFPELGFDPSKAAIAKIRESLLAAMRERHWPVTFSIGVVTFDPALDGGTCDIQRMIKLADQLMYKVKNSSKDAVMHDVCMLVEAPASGADSSAAAAPRTGAAERQA